MELTSTLILDTGNATRQEVVIVNYGTNYGTQQNNRRGYLYTWRVDWDMVFRGYASNGSGIYQVVHRFNGAGPTGLLSPVAAGGTFAQRMSLEPWYANHLLFSNLFTGGYYYNEGGTAASISPLPGTPVNYTYAYDPICVVPTSTHGTLAGYQLAMFRKSDKAEFICRNPRSLQEIQILYIPDRARGQLTPGSGIFDFGTAESVATTIGTHAFDFTYLRS